MSWKNALDEFLKPWERRGYVSGALLTGSYAIGMEDGNSDIDIAIILSDDISWRERGNKRIGGHLFEYFANGVSVARREFAREREENSRVLNRMFAIGRILFDKQGDAQRLQRTARSEMKRPFSAPDRNWVEQQKYRLWDKLEELRCISSVNAPGRDYLCKLLFDFVLKVNAKYHRREIVNPSKLHRLLTNSEYRAAYQFELCDDVKIRALVIRYLEDGRFEQLEELTLHLLTAMGGFEIDGWRSRVAAI